MNDPHDRALEFALREIHGGPESTADERDFAGRVASAWRRGERGSGIEGLATVAPAGAGRVHGAGRLSPARIAAVGVLLAGAALLVDALRPAVEEQTATAPPRVDAPFESEASSGLVVHTNVDFELALAGGGSVKGRTASLSLAGPRLQLEEGAVSLVTSAEHPLLIESAAGSVLLYTGSRASMRVDLDVPAATAAELALLPDAARAQRLAAEGASYPRWMDLELEEGRAWLLRPGTASLDLRPGERIVVAEEGALRGPLDEADLERGRELVAALLTPGGSPWSREPYGLDEPDLEHAQAAELAQLLLDHPQYWPALRLDLRAAFEGAGDNPTGCSRCVRFLVYHPSAAAFDLARELWLRGPGYFAPECQVVLAVRGAEEFGRETRAIVEIEPYGELAAYLMPAAYQALLGNARGCSLLERIVEQPDPRPAQLFGRLLAARSLAACGDREAWTATREETLAGIERSLAHGPRSRAALHAAAIEFLDHQELERDGDHVNEILCELVEHCRQRTKELDGGGALEALLAELNTR